MKWIVNNGILGSFCSGGREHSLLLTIWNRDTCLHIPPNGKELKTTGENYARTYVKEDGHPSVRREWKGLRKAEARENNRPENVRCVITLDTRQRILYRDDDVINSWNSHFFLKKSLSIRSI